jgi:hypothetical protein
VVVDPKPIRLAAPGQPGTPLMAVAYGNSGSYRAAGRAMATLISWGIAESKLGRPLGDDVQGHGHTMAAIREYSEWWKQSERTTQRDLAAFRAAFPGEDLPARLAALLRERRLSMQARKDATAAVHSVLVAA